MKCFVKNKPNIKEWNVNNSINDVSFKAQMVIQLSGRHNIMSRVAKDFAKKTENIPGQLFIKRGARYENPGTIEISNGFSTYVMSKYDNFEKLSTTISWEKLFYLTLFVTHL